MGESGEQMRDRSGVGRAGFRLFVEAPRWAVAGGLLVIVVGSVVAVGVAAGPLRGDPVETLFQTLVGATVTGVTLVVTLNQLVLSEELGDVGDQRERMAGATDFRRDVEDVIGEIAPTDPSAFLAALLSAAAERAETARDAADATGEAGGSVGELADRVAGSAGAARERLDDAEFGSSEVTRAALGFDYSRAIDRTRRVRAAGDLPAESDAALSDLVEVLEMYGVAREHVKTLYFRRALIDLSRSILLAAVPALAVGIAMLLHFRPGRGTTTPLVVGLAVGVVLAPFAVLVAYVLRIVTVTGRTLSIGPFTLRETDRDPMRDGR